MLPDDERVTVELDNLGGRVTVRADTVAKHDPPKRHPKLFDKGLTREATRLVTVIV